MAVDIETAGTICESCYDKQQDRINELETENDKLQSEIEELNSKIKDLESKI